jgi:hypothetical protein
VYKKLVVRVARIAGTNSQDILESMASRSGLINRYDRATGDALICVTHDLIRNRRKFTITELNRIIRSFVEQQILRPEYFEQCSASKNRMHNVKSIHLLGTMLETVEAYREGI